jgi:hypothetical protein
LRDLRNNPNLRGVDTKELLGKTPEELLEMNKLGEINNKTLKQIQKAFEGRDLANPGQNQ